MKRIAITVCHGISSYSNQPLPAEHLDQLMKIASNMGFESINYDQLAAWRDHDAPLPDQPIMIDFDHPVLSMRHEVNDILSTYGFKGNLFINTEPMMPDYKPPKGVTLKFMSWQQVGELMDLGWHIGAHTVTHPDLSKLSVEDPSGEKIRAELEQCDATLEKHLGIKPRDFAYTGMSYSTIARNEVAKRYRFGRLWITQSHYNDVDGQKMRYAELVNIEGDDQPDGGPPIAARYIYKNSDPYLLPSMELQKLIYTPEAFHKYLEQAL